ncbi:MAG: glycosyltransferase family 2 protein [bacterium]
MSSSTKASVIIPTYRRRQKLLNLLKTLSQQSTSLPFEVIVVNDDEDEDISGIVELFPALKLRAINLRAAHGRPVARNQGARYADGEVLIFVDDDMTVNAEFIDAHIRTHIHPRVAAVGLILAAEGIPRTHLARYIEYQGLLRHIKEKKLPPKVFRTGNASVGKRMFTEVGMFDESIRTYGEDMDLAMRLSYCGAEFLHAKGAVAYHHDQLNIDDFLAKVWEWGRYTLPRHAEKHPDFAESIWLHLALPPKLGREPFIESVKKLLLRFSLSHFFYWIAKRLLVIPMPQKLAFALIDYLKVYTYIKGYLEALSQKNGQ